MFSTDLNISGANGTKRGTRTKPNRAADIIGIVWAICLAVAYLLIIGTLTAIYCVWELLKSALNSKIRTAVVVFATVGVFVTFTFGPYYGIIYNSGISMSPTYEDGDMIVMKKASTDWRPTRYDVIAVVDTLTEDLLIKRVIVLPGEQYQIIDGKMHINGKLLEDYRGAIAYEKGIGTADMKSPETVPPGHIWIIGDHRLESIYGVYPTDQVRGTIIW